MNENTRKFEIKPAVRSAVPLLIGLFGPSGGGKTFTALRLATGIQKVFPGPIVLIDTENGRGLHYADQFNYEYVKFDPPFGSVDYLQALQFAASKNPAVIIVDSMSHEHEGPGGLLDFHEQVLDRMAGNDYKKRERVKMLAWSEPKQARRKLLNGLLQIPTNFIFCFRAKESSRPTKDPRTGKNKVENFGFTPICGDEFAFEMTMNCLLPPHANGVPVWNSDRPGERMMMKLPEQFKGIFNQPGIQLDERIGHMLASWAKGNTGESQQQPQQQQPQQKQLHGDQQPPQNQPPADTTPKQTPQNNGKVNEVLPGELIENVFNSEDAPEKKLILEWALVQNGEIQNHVANILLRADSYDNSPEGRAEKLKEYLRLYILHPKVRGHKLDDGRNLSIAFDQSIKTETDIRQLWEAVKYGHSVIGGK